MNSHKEEAGNVQMAEECVRCEGCFTGGHDIQEAGTSGGSLASVTAGWGDGQSWVSGATGEGHEFPSGAWTWASVPIE